MSKCMLRKPEVLRRTGMKKTQLDEAIREGKFPRGVPVFEDGRALGWFEDEVDAHIESRRAARDAAAAAAPPKTKVSTVEVAAKTPKQRRKGRGQR
jgi:prophage regulatory protein